MARFKNANWVVSDDNVIPTTDQAQLAVLMDLRDELQGIKAALVSINGVLHCPSTQSIPGKLECIRRNTLKKKRKR